MQIISWGDDLHAIYYKTNAIYYKTKQKKKKKKKKKKQQKKKKKIIKPAEIFTQHTKHCRLNELSHTIYWKILISILGMSGYVLVIFHTKIGSPIYNLDPDQIHLLQRLIWVCTVCQLPF